MVRKLHIIILSLVCLAVFHSSAYGQPGIINRLPRMGGGGGGGGGNDSLEHRTGLEDSITINFRYLDSSRLQKFDSTLADFSIRYPVPWYSYHLGNVGNATRSLIHQPMMTPGWDIGFHAYDNYNFNDYDTRFYNTTRPFSEIQYQLGSRLEQVLGLLHTQNIKPNWNASFQYRMINSPGFFQNQNTSHNNYRIGSWITSKNKRYQNFFVLVGNKLISGENGGIKNDLNYLDDVTYDERSIIPTQLGLNAPGSRNFFSSDVATGTKYTNASYQMRQQYDLIGDKDSILTDSTVIPLFYPRLRAEHTISYRTYHYRFIDANPDSTYYGQNYDILVDSTVRRFVLQDRWRDLTNDFSFYQFPDAKNSQQFVKAGASVQLLTGIFDTGTVQKKYHNFMVHGEYRNKSRNQKWDIEAYGHFYISGLNAGDYDAHISLKRLISKKIGSFQVGFGNVNRTPSFVFDTLSSFYVGIPVDFKKENNTTVFGTLDFPRIKLNLTGRYTLLSNYSYYSDYANPAQYSPVFNLLQLMLQKQFTIGGNWHWRTWITLQKVTGDVPLNLPLLFTRNQIGYDGSLGFKNLQMSTGIEFRYYTPYYADRYSPLLGQFFYQNSEKVEMNIPELAAYLHFRIKTFTAYVRVENLNAFNPTQGNFTNNNIVSPNYPYPGMQFKLGVYWSFVN